MEDKKTILSFESLLIGYSSGRSRTILLPPLSACAFQGELVAIIGQNGIGKSTLLRTIAGLHNSLGGSININGKIINSYSRMDFARTTGYISTEPVRVTNMKVYDLVALGRYPHTGWLGKVEPEDHATIMEAINKAGLKSYVNRYITELSDGERQRAMIARVLAQDTDLLIMDEPTAFLDIKSKYEIVHLLHDLSKNRSKTIIFTTHDHNIAVSEADKIWLILKDSFIEGAPEDLILNGAFNRLFQDSLVRFNQEEGSFSFRKEFKGSINIFGDGIARIWTEKALNRAGYAVSESDAELKVEITSGDSGWNWMLEKDSVKKVFSSVYDLITWLSDTVG